MPPLPAAAPVHTVKQGDQGGDAAWWEASRERMDEHRLSRVGKRIYKRRKETVERSFADGKQLHGHRYARFRGLKRVRQQCLLAAMAQDIKKIALLLTIRGAIASTSSPPLQALLSAYITQLRLYRRLAPYQPTSRTLQRAISTAIPILERFERMMRLLSFQRTDVHFSTGPKRLRTIQPSTSIAQAKACCSIYRGNSEHTQN
jgi:Transposase DDE domain